MPYFVGCLIFTAGLISHYFLNNYFTVVWALYVILPLLDYLLPVDHFNYSENRARIMEKDKRFLAPLYVSWAFDFYLLYWILYEISTGHLGTNNRTFILYILCAAQHGAINAAMGHEMIHRRGLVHKICGTAPYFKMIYSHFYIEHLRLHHKKVATPQDP